MVLDCTDLLHKCRTPLYIVTFMLIQLDWAVRSIVANALPVLACVLDGAGLHEPLTHGSHPPLHLHTHTLERNTDPAVRSMATTALPVLACVMVLDGMNAIVAGVLRVAGRQRLGAIVNGAACSIAIPAAWLLAFKFNMGVPGAWMGVGVG